MSSPVYAAGVYASESAVDQPALEHHGASLLAAELTELLERPRRGEARPPAQCDEGGKHEGGLVELGAGGLVDEAARPARRQAP